jgi:hypothetical protein
MIRIQPSLADSWSFATLLGDERSYAIAARHSDRRRVIDADVIIRRANIAVGVTTAASCGT